MAEKAIDEAVRLQFARLPDALATPDWLQGRHCLVAGLGPIGLLAALALQLRGAKVFGLDIVDAASVRAQWLTAIGGQYVDARQVPADQVNKALGPMELIIEATGIAALEFNLLDALALDGVYVLTGIPGGHRPIEIRRLGTHQPAGAGQPGDGGKRQCQPRPLPDGRGRSHGGAPAMGRPAGPSDHEPLSTHRVPGRSWTPR